MLVVNQSTYDAIVNKMGHTAASRLYKVLPPAPLSSPSNSRHFESPRDNFVTKPDNWTGEVPLANKMDLTIETKAEFNTCQCKVNRLTRKYCPECGLWIPAEL